MRIDIISAVPELLSGPFNSSIIRKSIEKNITEIHIHNLREYSKNKYKSIDDYQYGGGAAFDLREAQNRLENLLFAYDQEQQL